MVVEEFANFWEWSTGGGNLMNGAWLMFIYIVIACGLVGLLFGYLVAVIRHGPFEAFYVCANVVFQTLPDIVGTSPRRIFAIARLSAKEAFRRRVILIAFLIFALALLFGGWFLNSGSKHPERVYVNFVMWGAQLLILMMTLLISAFSLPEDIKNKTIYTVATKPVRPTEMILGRILGFATLGTGLLALMAVLSLGFVWSGLNHSHQLDLDDPTEAGFVAVNPKVTGRRPSELAIKEAFTTANSGHKHIVEILEDVRPADAPPPNNMASVIRQENRGSQIAYYRVAVKNEGGHTHTATVDESTGNIALSSAKGFFRARVPVYAKRLDFFDRQGSPRHVVDKETGELELDKYGNPITSGKNVGEIWTYRGYIDGGATLSRAQFDFEDFGAERFGEAEFIPLELTLSVFRSHTGDKEKRVRIGIQIESVPDDPKTEPTFRSEVFDFESEEFLIQVRGIPRAVPGNLYSPKGEQIQSGFFDLFSDFAKNRKLRLSLTCLDQGQYIGVAKADVYFRASEGQYWINFFKAYVGIWFQMLIVISLAVGLSTFLSSPVTMLVSIGALVFGFFSQGIREITIPDRDGGGPIESAVRLLTQMNMQTRMEDSVQVSMMKWADGILLKFLEAMTYVMPDFSRLNFTEFVKFGYYIDDNRMLVAAAITFSFCIGISVFAYFCLKTRELAA